MVLNITCGDNIHYHVPDHLVNTKHLPGWLPIVLLLIASLLTSMAGAGQVLKVGPTRDVKTIAAAAAKAQDGDTVEIDAGDYVGDVAVWKQDRLMIRGVGGKAQLLAAGQSAEKKAIWVIRGGSITVENIIFKGAKVPDKNGAGIRFEKGHLRVKNCGFFDNENGILTGGGDSTLEVENSEFGNNGHGDGYSHGIYVGGIKLFKLTGSYFHHSKIGHLVKTRAAENHILYNRITDETGGTASYELDISNGGIAYVIGNIIQQSSTSENSTIIAYGMEGYKWPVNELYLSFNTIMNDRPQGGIFVNAKAGDRKIIGRNNLLSGKGSLNVGLAPGLKELAIATAKQWGKNEPPLAASGPVLMENNPIVDWDVFAQASRFDYRSASNALAKHPIIESGTANNVSLEPQREYTHPASSAPLRSRPRWPGAIQSYVP